MYLVLVSLVTKYIVRGNVRTWPKNARRGVLKRNRIAIHPVKVHVHPFCAKRAKINVIRLFPLLDE